MKPDRRQQLDGHGAAKGRRGRAKAENKEGDWIEQERGDGVRKDKDGARKEDDRSRRSGRQSRDASRRAGKDLVA